MATKKSSKASQGNKYDKGDKKGGGKKSSLAPTQDPIIITGGSVKLEYANRSIDGFRDNSSGGGRKKLKHKRNSEDNPADPRAKANLTRIDVFTPRNAPSNSTPLRTIDLAALGISRNCRIEIHYDFE